MLKNKPPKNKSKRTAAAAGPSGGPADTESRILDAARRVFMSRGTAGARMQEIAAEAGVSQALLHYHFGSKHALAEQVFLEVVRSVVKTLTPIGSNRMSFEASIELFVTSYIDTVRKTPFIPGYLLAEAHQNPERLNTLMQRAIGVAPAQVASEILSRIEGIIHERVAAGTLRPISARQLLINVLSLTVMPFVARPVLDAVLGFDNPTFDEFLDERRRELPTFILNALRP
jgi:TetR/AcrR family transcriptional regulator